jgi:ABC-type Na+ efflux pump permease subunit
MIAVLVIYVNSIAPIIVGVFLDRFQELFLSHAAVAIVQILLFTIFIYFILVPITNTLRAEQTIQLEIFLAAPIKPSDVILGEYLGILPLYTILITIVSGFFTALLRPFGLDYNQLAFIILLFVVTFLTALWIGTIIAALLRARLSKTEHGRDI